MNAKSLKANLTTLQSTFDDQSSTYEKQVGGITRKYVRHLIERVPPITSESVIHDNACGTGAVTDEVLKNCKEERIPRVWGTDVSDEMLKVFRSLIEARGWAPSVTADIMDGSNLSAIPDNTFTHSITNFGFFVFPDPLAAPTHIYRTLKPGGHAILTTWSHPRQVYLANAVVRVIRPEQPEWWPLPKCWLDKHWILNIFYEAGFEAENVRCEQVWDSGKYESGGEFMKVQKNAWMRVAREGWSEEENGKWDSVCWEMMTEREREGWFDQEAFVFTLRKKGN